MRLQDAFEDFIAAKEAMGRAPATIASYRSIVEPFFRWLEEEEVGAEWFTAATLERYFAQGRARGLSPVTIESWFRQIHIFFRWLRVRGYLPKSTVLPTEEMGKPTAPATRPTVVDYEEYQQLLDSIPRATWVNRRDRLMVSTLFLTGVRRKSLVGLRIPDYRLDDGVLYVAQTKNGSDHTVPLLPAVIAAFQDYLALRPPWPTDKVFVSTRLDGDSIGVLTGSGVHQRIKFLCKRAGLREVNPHAFRHGLAMYLLNEKGADVGLIQRVLGHEKIEVTQQTYARWTTRGLSAQFRKLMTDA